MRQPARPYQTKLKNDAYAAWGEGARTLMGVLPTGGGKTFVMGEMALEYDQPGIAIAHRQELVGQISMALANEGVRHSILAPDAVKRKIIRRNYDRVGRDFIDPNARWRVGGVDTVIRMRPHELGWAKSIGLVFQDEGHHVLKANKWGKAYAMFPNGRGFFPTATPHRADGHGLGIESDGVVDRFVIGPNTKRLMDSGYVTNYEIFVPTAADLDLTHVEISPVTGEMNQDQMRKAVKASRRIVGDVVKHYLKLAPGKLGITFAADVEEAGKIAVEFRSKGVPAEVISADTPTELRDAILARFARREILQLVNVDLFGEGFDLPALEVVSFARPTQSLALYLQQLGRVLRIMISDFLKTVWDTLTDAERLYHISQSAKPFGIVIDHVGNFLRHGPAEKEREPSLLRRERQSASAPIDEIPLRACLGCAKPFDRSELACPYCKEAIPEPGQRGGPKFVDGDLYLLTMEMRTKMLGDVKKIDGLAYPPGHLDAGIKHVIVSKHLERQRSQMVLREAMGIWSATQTGYEERVQHKRFYFMFGIDSLSALSLNTVDANALTGRIFAKLAVSGYDTTSRRNNEEAY